MEKILEFIKKQSKLTKAVSILSIFIIIILYSLVGIVYKNYRTNKQIEDLRQEITQLEEDNIEQQSKILYYQTDAYIEKSLREKLGYKKEGEKIYALPRIDPERQKLIEEQKRYEELEEGKSNIIKWWDFFFKEEV